MRDKNKYQREYMAKRYAERVSIGIKRLGGACRHCGDECRLEFDHIDPSKKAFEVTAGTWMRMDRWLEEVDKCQLLCRSCHAIKSIADAGKTQAAGQHGSLSAYRHCKCADCRRAKAAWQAEYRARKRAGSIPAGGTNNQVSV